MSKKNSKTTKSDPETSIYTEYFQYTNQHRAQYGEKTVVLLQVGAFFEVYGMKNKKNDLITGSIITEFADVCQLNVSEKKIEYNNEHIVMAGFRDFTIDKYLAKLTEKEPKLGQKTILEIKEARERIKKGEFYTEDEAKKILGL